jgi:Na+/phosphate symporter
MNPSLTFSIPIVLLTTVGLLMYMLATNGKVAEVGRIMFQIGLFFLCASFAGSQLMRIP